MLNDANITPNWRDVPSASSVRKQLKKRARRRLNKILDQEIEISDTELEYAQRLLDGRDARNVVAALVRRCQSEHPCEPRDIRNQPMPHFDRDGRKGPRRTDRPHSPDRDSRPINPRPPRRARGGADMTRFSINWGFRNGANPRRILALICRRGNITSRMVGSIDMEPLTSSFEVDSSIANNFETAARQPDPQDPGLRISRGGNAPTSEPHRRPFDKHPRPRGGGYRGGGYKGRPKPRPH